MKSRKRVALLLGGKSLSGAEKRFVRIFLASVASEIDYVLLVNRELKAKIVECPEFKDVLPEAGLIDKIVAFEDAAGKGPLGLWLQARQIHRLLRCERVQLIHATMMSTLSLSLLKLFGTQIVFEVTSPDIAKKVAGRTRWATARMDLLICVSPTVEQVMLKAVPKGYFAPGQVIVTPAAFFSPPAEIAELVQEKEPRVVFAARLIERKNPVLFATVAKQFLQMCPEWKVSILGDGPLEAAVKAILADEIGDERAFVGHVKDPYPLFASSALMVSLIDADNYPSQSVLEAMLMGNALLLSNRGASGRFLNGKNGRLVEIEEKQILKEMLELTADFSGLVEAGDSSRQHVLTHFSKASYLSHLRDVYEGVFSKRRSSSRKSHP